MSPEPAQTRKNNKTPFTGKTDLAAGRGQKQKKEGGVRIAEQSPHTAPNFSMKRSKVSVSTAQWCLIWARKIDKIDPTVALLSPPPCSGDGQLGPGLAVLEGRILWHPRNGEEEKTTSWTSVEGLRELHGTYKNPFVVQLGPQPPELLGGGLWAWQTSCWNEIPKPWGFQKRSL